MSLRSRFASWERADYFRAMATAFFRLLALLALVLMPLSMASAPASAQPTAAAPAGHCDDHQNTLFPYTTLFRSRKSVV